MTPETASTDLAQEIAAVRDELAAVRAQLDRIQARQTVTPNRRSPTKRDWRGAIRYVFTNEHPGDWLANREVLGILASHGIEISRTACSRELTALHDSGILDRRGASETSKKATQYRLKNTAQ